MRSKGPGVGLGQYRKRIRIERGHQEESEDNDESNAGSDSDQGHNGSVCGRPANGKVIVCGECDRSFPVGCVSDDMQAATNWYCDPCLKPRKEQTLHQRRIELARKKNPPTSYRSPARNVQASFDGGLQTPASTSFAAGAGAPARINPVWVPTGTASKLTSNASMIMAVQPSNSEKFACCKCKKWPMVSPIYQCSKGHSICSPCSLNLKTCRTCGENLAHQKILAPAIEALQTPLLKCNQDGCRVVFTNVDEMTEHVAAVCPYKELPFCKIIGYSECEAKIRPREAVEHLKQVHKVVEHEKLDGQVSRLRFFTRSYMYLRLPQRTCVKYRDAVIVILEDGKQRPKVKLFAAGDPQTLKTLTFCIETNLGFAPANFPSKQNKFVMKIAPFNGDQIQVSPDYREKYTFDVSCNYKWTITQENQASCSGNGNSASGSRG